MHKTFANNLNLITLSAYSEERVLKPNMLHLIFLLPREVPHGILPTLQRERCSDIEIPRASALKALLLIRIAGLALLLQCILDL